MAPRATSSCRLCRQFILPSALDPELETIFTTRTAAISRGDGMRGGIQPSQRYPRYGTSPGGGGGGGGGGAEPVDHPGRFPVS